MKIEIRHLSSIIAGIIIALFDFIYFSGTPVFIPLLLIAVIVSMFHFGIDLLILAKKRKEIERRFPDFVRNLVGAIKSGMPIGESVQYVARTDYGALSYHVKKLANKISWGIPVYRALNSFAEGTKNLVIKRAIITVIEAERAGGNIEDVLESITTSVISIKNIKERRRASIYGQIITSYIIFAVFLAVMIIIQNFLVPYVLGVEETIIPGLSPYGMTVSAGIGGIVRKVVMDFSSFGTFMASIQSWFISLNGVFMMLALIEGFFAGVVIGKLGEGELSAGIKHSLILMITAFLVISFAQGFL